MALLANRTTGWLEVARRSSPAAAVSATRGSAAICGALLVAVLE